MSAVKKKSNIKGSYEKEIRSCIKRAGFIEALSSKIADTLQGICCIFPSSVDNRDTISVQ